jgi:uncharacterized membrane protein YccC
MDVHPPRQAIHSWKDFLLHLLTITVGLFIALTLEAAVESLHHRHLVRDARDMLQREIASNQTLYADNVRRIEVNRATAARHRTVRSMDRQKSDQDSCRKPRHCPATTAAGLPQRHRT